MNIFLHEFRANLKSLIIWSVISVLFIMVGFSKFSAFYENPELLAILDSMPPALIEAFSMNSFDLTTLSGFFGVILVYFGLLLSIAAAMWGSDIISKEERDRTVEFSLTLPVRRSQVVSGKLAAAAVNCILLLLVTWGFILISAQNYEPDATFYEFASLGMLGFFFLEMIFLAVGIFLGCALKKHKRAGSAAVAVILVAYFVSIVTGLNKDLDFLKYTTPFKYFDSVYLLRNLSLETPYVLLSLGIIAVLLAGAYLTYSRRDLYI
jgi:ABC-2 type transport system permease protein